MTEAPQNLRQIEIPKIAKNPIRKVKLPKGLCVGCFCRGAATLWSDTWVQKLLVFIHLVSMPCISCTETKIILN